MNENLQEMYNDIRCYIKNVDFDNLWPGFYPFNFVLYNEKECFYNGKYIPKTSEFLANTAIEYNNEVIAIWNVLEEIDIKVLTSKIIHEMFHGYQKVNNELRFPDEINAIYNYKYSDENLSIKLIENKLIVDLVKCFDAEKFKLLLRLKKYRYNKYNYEFIYESQVEQVEGAANFIELCALKEINHNLYLEKLNKMVEALNNPKQLFPVRIISYDSGALLLYILKENGIKFNNGFTNVTFVEELISGVEAIEIFDKLCMKPYIDDYFSKGKEVIENAINTKNVVLDKQVNLLGFNVYNAIYLDGYIISKYFVMYDDNGPVILYGDFVIETPQVGIITKIYQFK